MLSLIISTLCASATVHAMSGKRGIAGVDNVHTLGDQATLLAGNASTWAYNYGSQPGNATWFGELEFVPQCWGGNDAPGFMASVLANTPATRHILTFNEPDGSGGGQATMTPAMAAALWSRYIEPLKSHGITLGSPACTGTDEGIQWLKEFYGNCTTCSIDFIATHWYGDFQGLAAHLGNLYNVFNGTKIWVTELGMAHASLDTTQGMFNTTVGWLDNLNWVDRYAWFGAFRSTDSNVGTNATFLDGRGDLTTLGREYLYQVASSSNTTTTTATTSGPSTSTSSQSSSSAATTGSTTSKSDAGKLSIRRPFLTGLALVFMAATLIL